MTQPSDDIKTAIELRAAQMAPIPEPDDNGDLPIAFVRDCFKSNEMGDGVLFSAVHKNNFIYNTDSKRWYQWAGHHWTPTKEKRVLAEMEVVVEQYQRLLSEPGKKAAPDEDDEAADKRVKANRKRKADILGRIKGLRSKRRRANALDFATSNKVADLSVSDEQLDLDPWLLACKNGVIDLRTGRLLPGRRDHYITRATDVEYQGIDAKNEDWEKFVFEVIGEKQEVADFVRRFYGYAATGLQMEKIFLILNGRGWNGKGLMVETINKVLGAHSVPIAAEMLLDTKGTRDASAPSPALLELKGRRLVYASETDDGARFSASRVKWLSGGDTVRARYPYAKEAVYFSPTHTLVLLTNSIPYASASDYAFWERAKVVEFPFSYVENPTEEYERPIDKTLADTLQKNMAGILSWIVRGCLEYQQKGLAAPPSVLAATEDQREEEDTFQIWIDECCNVDDPMARTGLSKMYEHFKGWWKDVIGTRPPGRRTWAKIIRSKGFTKTKSGTYFFHGITLKTQYYGQQPD